MCRQAVSRRRTGMLKNNITKSHRIADRPKTCAICGREVTSDATTDHIFPRGLYKWMKHLPKNKLKRLKAIIESSDNKIVVHKCCNELKEDSIPDINVLYMKEDRKERLHILQVELSDTLREYSDRKQSVLDEQNGFCIQCGYKINTGVLRRIDPSKERTFDNACVVCHKCNKKKAEFISAYEAHRHTGV